MKVRTNFFFRLVFISALIVSFNSCSKDDGDSISLSVSEKRLNYDGEYQIDAVSNSAITYTVENEYHAEVSETGRVTARFVGETNILLQNAEDKKNFKVIVEPQYNLYQDPQVEFGDTKKSVISKFGTNYTTSGTAIGYDDYSVAAPMIMFLFDANDKLDGYAVVVDSPYSTSLVGFLLERYLAVGEQDGMFLFINGLSPTTASTIVGLELYSDGYWIVIYVPNASNTKSAAIGKVSTPKDFNQLYKNLIEKIN